MGGTTCRPNHVPAGVEKIQATTRLHAGVRAVVLIGIPPLAPDYDLTRTSTQRPRVRRGSVHEFEP